MAARSTAGQHNIPRTRNKYHKTGAIYACDDNLSRKVEERLCLRWNQNGKSSGKTLNLLTDNKVFHACWRAEAAGDWEGAMGRWKDKIKKKKTQPGEGAGFGGWGMLGSLLAYSLCWLPVSEQVV